MVCHRDLETKLRQGKKKKKKVKSELETLLAGSL